MSADLDLFRDREPLRDTPEGELWTSVLVDALEGLGQAREWLESSYGERLARIERAHESGELKPARYRERLRDLERERREREQQLASCEWFFFDPDSSLDFICEVLDYPAHLIREHARRLRGEDRPAPARSFAPAENGLSA